ncbi:MAG: hypothetical protein HY290_06715 [Planctomycetia bacterium]|nr:hypothetical protein [Planctomycetia bacterium]
MSQNPIAKAVFRNVVVDEAPLACMVVNQRIVLILSALFDTNDFNVNRGRSYLKSLDLEYGIAVDFGKRRAEFIGIRRSK